MKLFSKKDNKGFSLVELIVVVAIMAVLMGILVPTLVKNVEKSKKQKDISGIEEIRSQFEKCLADENYSSIEGSVAYSSGKVDVSTGATTAPTGLTASSSAAGTNVVAKYFAEVSGQITDYTCKSKEYSGATVTYYFKDERVSYKVTNTKSKEDVTSDNFKAGDAGAVATTAASN